MAVSAHGYQVTLFFLDPFDDLVGGISVGQFCFGGDSSDLKFLADFFQISCVFGDLGTNGVGAVGAGGPSIGNVKEDQAALRELGQLFDVLDDGAVGGSAVERH